MRGFGCKVIVYDPYVPADRVRTVGAEPVGTPEELLKRADVISLHAVLTEETYHMLDRNAFRRMKRGVITVNTARGELIDTQALVEALEEGRVAAAALDVVEGEPIGPDHPLLRFENVIVTLHVAAYTREALRGMDMAVVKAIEDYLAGRPVEGAVVTPARPRPLKLQSNLSP